ncbi:MAG: hypothetical protein K6E65_03080, partial [Olsenella sp.]|nr:hypothetical protein [Olsenella sp.]
ELQSLCLDIRMLDEDGNEVIMRESVDEEFDNEPAPGIEETMSAAPQEEIPAASEDYTDEPHAADDVFDELDLGDLDTLPSLDSLGEDLDIMFDTEDNGDDL